jgi:hypothetical protein
MKLISKFSILLFLSVSFLRLNVLIKHTQSLFLSQSEIPRFTPIHILTYTMVQDIL